MFKVHIWFYYQIWNFLLRIKIWVKAPDLVLFIKNISLFQCTKKLSLVHDVFTTEKKGTLIALSKTNILKQGSHQEFMSLFSGTSFSTTLEKLIKCGQYNKPEKRTTPMYCFGSTITCTRYPKFFWEGAPRFYRDHIISINQTMLGIK